MVVWQRDNGGSSDNDLYGQRLGADGSPFGDGFVLLEADDDQQRPVMVGDGTGSYLLAWQDNRNGNWDIYGSLFLPSRVIEYEYPVQSALDCARGSTTWWRPTASQPPGSGSSMTMTR
jgi:hypothetical protein